MTKPPVLHSRPQFRIPSIVLLVIIAIETVILYNVAPIEVAKMMTGSKLTVDSLNLTALLVGLPVVLAGIAAFLATLLKQAAHIAPRARLVLLILMAAPALIIPYYIIALLGYPTSASTDSSGQIAELLVGIGSWLIWIAYSIGAFGLGTLATLGLIRAVRSSKK